MDSQEGSRLPAADSSGQNTATVKQSASLPPAFHVRPQGPPSAFPRLPINNGSGGLRLGGPQPPTLRRLDSRSSLVTGQRPFGPTSPQGAPIRPQGFPQQPPQPQLFSGKNQGFPNSPGGGPPKRFPSGPPQGQRLQTPPAPRAQAPAGQAPRPPINQPPLGPMSLQYNTARPQAFPPQRTSSQSSIHSGSPDESRPGTPSSGGRLSTIFPPRQLMSGPESLPLQANFEASREARNDLPMNNDSTLQRNPLDPRSFQNPSSIVAGTEENKLETDGKLNSDLLATDKKPGANILGNPKPESLMESFNGKQKSSIANDDDDDVVFDSDPSKTLHSEKREQSGMKNGYETASERPETSPPRTGMNFDQKRDANLQNISECQQSAAGPTLRAGQSSGLMNEPGNHSEMKTGTPELSKSPGPHKAATEYLNTADKLLAEEGNSGSPIVNGPSDLASPIAPASLEHYGELTSIPSPLASQEFEKRLSISDSSESSPESLNPNAMGSGNSNVRSMSLKSLACSSSPSPNPPESPLLISHSPNLSNPPDSPGTRSPVSSANLAHPQKSLASTPQSPNTPKSPGGCLRSLEGDKSGRSTPDVEGGKKRATFAKDLIMSTNNKDDERAASTISDVKDFELITPEESSNGTPTTPGTPRKSFASSADRNRHRSRSPKSGRGKSLEKESAATRNRVARESKDRNKTSTNRFGKTEGDNDSGVDESTQGNELTTNGDTGSPTKTHSKIPGPKRSTSSSPTKSPSKSAKGLKTPETAVATSASENKKKLPMNKIQVGAAPSPNLKTVRSKIGSLDNASYKPGGGKIKIENRKLDFSKAQPKIAAKNDKYTPSGGDKKITQVKLQWNAKPKVGSLENSTYKPGGGDKKIETVKLDFKEKAKPKVASKDNVKHVPGGGTVKSLATPPETPQRASDDIETLKIEVKAESKVGSMDNVKHKPGGGDKKIFNDKDYLRQTGSNVESLSGSGSQDSQGNIVLNVISPSPVRRVKKLAQAEDGNAQSSHDGKSSSPVSATPATPSRPKPRSEQMPVPLTTTPVDEKKVFSQARKSSLVRAPDRSKTPEVEKKVTISETDEVREIEMKRTAKSPVEKRPKTPEERRPSTPRHEASGAKTLDPDSKPTTPRTRSSLKSSSGGERQKSPRKKSNSGETPAAASGGKVTPRKERSSPPNSLPLNNPEGTNEKTRKSSSKEFRLPKIVANVLPELNSQDFVISTSGSDSKIALPKLVDTPTAPSQTGVVQ